jgi:hypothetical protein
MRRIFPALLALALPMAAIAAFTTPSALLSSLQYNGKPLNISYQLQGHAKNMKGSDANITFFSSFKGAVEGKDLKSAKMNMKISLDVTGIEGNGAVHALAQVRVSDQKLFFMLENLNGTYEPESLSQIMNAYGKTWYALPISQLEQQQQEYSKLSQDNIKDIVKQCIDAVFTIERSASQGGSLYSITVKQEAAQSLLTTMMKVQEQYPTAFTETNKADASDLAILKEVFSHLNIHIKVLTDAKDTMRAVKSYLSFAWAKEDMGDFQMVFTGESKGRSAPVTVVVPKIAIDLSSNVTAPPTQTVQPCVRSDSRAPCASKPSTRR